MASNSRLDQLHELGKKVHDYMCNYMAKKLDDREYQDDLFRRLLQDICSLVRDFPTSDPEYELLLAKADGILSDAVSWVYDDDVQWDFLKSFAHSDANPVIGDDHGRWAGVEGRDTYKTVRESILIWKAMSGKADTELPPGIKAPKIPEPWTSLRSHPTASPLSRFMPGITVSATLATPAAKMIYDARCEITDKSISSPMHMNLSSNGECLVIPSMGGYSNRAPLLQYQLFDDNNMELPALYTMKPGLMSVAYWTAIDEIRKVIFAADTHRIKSYAWHSPTGYCYGNVLPMHTMDCDDVGLEGPIAVLAGGRFIRAGELSVGVWNLDSLETHGPKGTNRIGDKISLEDSWRDDLEDIERSEGSGPDAVVKLSPKTPSPSVWCGHPSIPGTMLYGAIPYKSDNYACFALDLEHGGKIVTRYLGHGGEIREIVPSAADPAQFVTACTDGYARLFDVRQALPALTFDVGKAADGCTAVAIGHPDGIPTLFTGAGKQEEIVVWDLRTRVPVYELSTGNNAVVSVAWDASRNTLHAATRCPYVDSSGYRNGYRRAKVPKDQLQNTEATEPEDDGDEDDEDEDDDDNTSER